MTNIDRFFISLLFLVTILWTINTGSDIKRELIRTQIQIAEKECR